MFLNVYVHTLRLWVHVNALCLSSYYLCLKNLNGIHYSCVAWSTKHGRNMYIPWWRYKFQNMFAEISQCIHVYMHRTNILYITLPLCQKRDISQLCELSFLSFQPQKVFHGNVTVWIKDYLNWKDIFWKNSKWKV